MTDPTEKEKHSRRRKKNIYARILKDSGDFKGAFSLRILDPRKDEYKRKKVNARNFEEYEENE